MQHHLQAPQQFTLWRINGWASIYKNEKQIHMKTIIDVRTPQEFVGGNVAGSMNIPLQEITERVEEIKKLPQPIVLCCASGMRSGSAASILKRNGVEAYNAGPWQKADRLTK